MYKNIFFFLSLPPIMVLQNYILKNSGKKVGLLLMGVMLFFASACNKNTSIQPSDLQHEVFVSASFANGQTKSTVDNNHEIHWSKGDKLGMFATAAGSVSASAELTLNNVDAGLLSGKFYGKIEMTQEPSACYFCSPISSVFSLTGSEVSVTFDYSAQTGVHNPFLYSSPIPYSGAGMNCVMQHFGGMLRLKMAAGTISSVTFKGNNGEALTPYIYNYTTGAAGAISGALSVFTISVAASSTECYLAVPPVHFTKGFTLELTNTSGEKMYRSFNSDAGYDFSVNKGALIEIDATSFTRFGFDINAVPAHLVNADGNLYGSSVSLNSAVLSGAPAKLVTAWGADICNSGNTVVRNIESTGQLSGTVTTSNTSYLPQGTYSVKPYVVLSGNKLYGATKNMTVAAPELTVTSGALTSYSYYLNGNITAANGCNGSTIYVPAGSCKINVVPELLTSLRATVSYSLDGGAAQISTFSGNALSASNIANQSWAAHTFAVNITFDGKTYSASNGVQVTGLPYDATPPTNGGDHPWSAQAGKITWNADNVSLYYTAAKYPCVATPAFHVPENINIELRTKIVRNYYFFSVKGNINVYQINGEEEIKLINQSLAREETLEGSYSVTMNSAYDHKWYIRYNYTATGPETWVYYFRLNYR